MKSLAVPQRADARNQSEGGRKKTNTSSCRKESLPQIQADLSRVEPIAIATSMDKPSIAIVQMTSYWTFNFENVG